MQIHLGTSLAVLVLPLASGIALLSSRTVQDPPAQDPPVVVQTVQPTEPVRIAFDPAVGLALERSWEDEHDLLSESVRLMHGEASVPMAGQMRLRSRHVLKVIDHFRELADGRPTNLRRTFTECRRDSQMGFREMQGVNPTAPMVQSSPLGKGVSVVFVWSPEESLYGRHYDATEGEEENLIGLEEDLDLGALLPPEPVAVGASWNVEPTALGQLFAPGGSIPYDLPRKTDPRLLRTLDSGLASGLDHTFRGQYAGTFVVSLREVRETDGRREAVLALESDFKVSSDQVEQVQSKLGPAERAAGMVFQEATLVLQFQGSGELVWDLDGGFGRSLSMELEERAKQRLVFVTAKTMDAKDTQDMQMAGKLTIQMSAQPIEPPPVPGGN